MQVIPCPDEIEQTEDVEKEIDEILIPIIAIMKNGVPLNLIKIPKYQSQIIKLLKTNGWTVSRGRDSTSFYMRDSRLRIITPADVEHICIISVLSAVVIIVFGFVLAIFFQNAFFFLLMPLGVLIGALAFAFAPRGSTINNDD